MRKIVDMRQSLAMDDRLAATNRCHLAQRFIGLLYEIMPRRRLEWCLFKLDLDLMRALVP